MPVYREWPADLDTPASVYLKLGKTPPAFLLESVDLGGRSIIKTFIGANPGFTLEASLQETLVRRQGVVERLPLSPVAGPDPLHHVQRLLAQHPVALVPGLPRFFGGAVGYMAYDLVRLFERLPLYAKDELKLPDAFFLFTQTLVIFDHIQQRIKVVTSVPGAQAGTSAYQEAKDRIDDVLATLSSPLPPSGWTGLKEAEGSPELVSNFTQRQFEDMVKQAKEYIQAGDAFQIVVSRRLSRPTTASAFSIYRALRLLNPSPYMFFLDFGPFQLIGSSPEMMVRLEADRAYIRPIAGTRPRGRTEEEDQALIADLMADPKERAEHVMLVDLARNDLGRVCRFGSVRVPLYMTAEKYSHVIHIVSSVEGELNKDHDAFNLFRASFPAGTVTGAPKVRAMEIINELEGTKRGPYAGAVGYFDYSGNMDTCITIRTIVKIGNTIYLQGGAGIVADSDPQREYQETWNKMAGMEMAVRLAEGSTTPAGERGYE